MTLSTTENRTQYECNGRVTIFPYPFKIIQSSDLYVVYTDLTEEDFVWTENTQYTVTAIGEETGGNVVVEEVYVPASGTTLTIYRNIPLTQETDYVENDPFHADTVETDLDRIIMILQQLAEMIGRAMLGNITEEGTIFLLPKDRANKYLKFDSDKTPIAVYLPDDKIRTGVDNHVARYDGEEFIQSSNVVIDDLGNVTGINDLTIDGTLYGDVDGYVTDEELASAITTLSGNISSLNMTTPTTDHSGQGEILEDGIAGENLVFGNFVYMKSDGKFWKANKGASTTMPIVAMALESITGNNTGKFLLGGLAKDASWTWTAGNILYGGSVGVGTAAPPSATGEQLQVIGVAISATVIRFSTDFTIVEID